MNTKPKPQANFETDITQGTINISDGKAALDFIDNYGTMKKLSKGSTDKYYHALRPFLKEIKLRGKTIPTLEEKDALALIKHVQKSQWSEASREDYWKRWLVFYEWLHDREGQQWDGIVSKMFTDNKRRYRYKIEKNRVEKKGILAPEEILQLLAVEAGLQYKTFFAVLYEGGLRAGEAFGLRLCDVEKNNGQGYTLKLSVSKTEKRTVPLVLLSPQYLNLWLKNHPQRYNPEAKLFLTPSGKGFEHTMCNKRLRLLMKRAGIQRRKISLHSFRHSRASELCNLMTESQLCRFFGWAQGSRMPATYIRAESIDVRKALLKAAGLEKQEEAKQTGKACLSCKTINALDAEYCDICRLPLDAKKVQQVMEASSTLNLVDQLLREKFAGYDEKIEKLRAAYSPAK